MALTRSGRVLRLTAALVVACLTLLVLTSGHGGAAVARKAKLVMPQGTQIVTPHDSSSCPPETASCEQVTTPFTADAGPVTNVGLNQAVYVDVSGVPVGDELEVAYCSLKGTGTQVLNEPQCASSVPQPGQTPTAEPEQYEYGTVTSNQTIMAIPSEFADPTVSGTNPIISQTSDQLLLPPTNQTSSFFCDNGPNPCGVEVMDIPSADINDLLGAGLPPNSSNGTNPYSPIGHTVIFPLTFSSGGNGCANAPVMNVTASYSATQFIPAAGQATCNGPNGVAALPTELNSTDDSGCATGGGTNCPIYNVINGSVPVTFTDDPEDPGTLAEEKAAGGKVAYIPIAVSATEIAFDGAAGITLGSNAITYPLDSYQLTPAQAAGIMTQTWTSAVAGLGRPNDDVCNEISGSSCTETTTNQGKSWLVETSKGKTANVDVSQPAALIESKRLSFTQFNYLGNFANDPGNEYIGETGGATPPQQLYFGDTGFALLNPWPFQRGGSPVNEETLAAMWPSTGSGATFESTSWMCDAPNTAYPVTLPYGGTANVTDILSGQQLLTNAEQDPVAGKTRKNKNPDGNEPGLVLHNVSYPASKCQGVSAFPIDMADKAGANQYNYQPSSQPLSATGIMQKAVASYGGSGGFAFSAMDSSEADFYGLLPASLQNAAGAFVAPSASGITAAINDAKANPDGTITPNYDDTGDPAAYPLPMVTYALVSTNPQSSATQATELKNLLTNLVNYSHDDGTSSSPLPAGYVALPDSLYNQAMTEIATDITGSSGSGSGGSGSGSGSSTNASTGGGAGATTNAAAAGAHGGSTSASSRGGSGHGSSPGASTPAGTAASSGNGSSGGGFIGHFITVTVGDNRYFVPTLLILALLCLLGGPLLYMYPGLRRPRAAGDGEDIGSPSGPGPPEEG
ncbi:MAG TPA: hypothetical protein VMF35_06125 [Acidimicrobiales bacterium]|nr:hypothetical protein [Acidimicrobiales bacterium]